MLAGRQDSETWPETRAMLRVAGTDPAVFHLVFPRGGHNYGNYRAHLADVLSWIASAWPH